MLKYLIVGYGNIGHKRKNILKDRCVATYDPDSNQKADFTNLLQIPMDSFDAVVLTTPQKPKLELVEYFLSKSKHVLVEKPLIFSPSQASKLKTLARKNKVIWYTSYNHRFEPNIVKIGKLLKKNFLGTMYHARLVYSFGNIKERIGTWREAEFSVLEEIAPHQIDFLFSSFGYKGKDFKTVIARKVESKIFDHWMLSTYDNKVVVECSAVTWKNVFLIEIYGKFGSIHMNSLRKWGGSELIVRKRVFPSGVPIEKKSLDQGPDTWEKDFKHFEKLVKSHKTTLKNDLEISIAINKLSREAKA